VACDNGQNFQVCNSTDNSVAYLTCGDIFQDEYDCVWRNNSGVGELVRSPLGELCELMPLPTETVVPSDYQALKIGLGTGVGVAGLFALGSFGLILNKHFRGKWFK
jgi:hypothetical protein